MKRQVVLTNWRDGIPPTHIYVDLGRGRATPKSSEYDVAGGGRHYRGTKSPPADTTVVAKTASDDSED